MRNVGMLEMWQYISRRATPLYAWWTPAWHRGDRRRRDKKSAAVAQALRCHWSTMAAAGKRKRGFSGRACASCLLLLQHNTTALLLHRSGGAIGPPGIGQAFLGRGMSRSWCGVRPWRERTGGGIRRTTPTMILDFFDSRARSQVRLRRLPSRA